MLLLYGEASYDRPVLVRRQHQMMSQPYTTLYKVNQLSLFYVYNS